VPQQMLNCNKIDSGPHEASCKRVPKTVESQMTYLRYSHGLHESHFRVTERLAPLARARSPFTCAKTRLPMPLRMPLHSTTTYETSSWTNSLRLLELDDRFSLEFFHATPDLFVFETFLHSDQVGETHGDVERRFYRFYVSRFAGILPYCATCSSCFSINASVHLEPVYTGACR
jgi:hypothetical protein